MVLLHLAVEKGKVGIVQKLVDAGADITARDISGKTALELARDRGLTEIVRVFVTEEKRRKAA